MHTLRSFLLHAAVAGGRNPHNLVLAATSAPISAAKVQIRSTKVNAPNHVAPWLGRQSFPAFARHHSCPDKRVNTNETTKLQN